MASTWRTLLERIQDKLALVPNLTASPQPFSAAALPETLMVAGGQQAFCVEIPSTRDAGERQRNLVTDSHAVVISVCSAINVAGAWATSLALIMDTEERIRVALLNVRDFSPYRVRWQGVNRALTPDRTHVLSTISVSVEHESEVV